MKKFVMVVLGAVAFALGTTRAAQALQLTFFGEDVGPGDAVISASGPLLSHLQADAAQANFLALLRGVHREAFDALPPLSIPHTLGTESTTGGSVLYFGLINTDHPFTRVTFVSPTTSDAFSFDNFTIASANQVVPGSKVVPEPDTLVLVGSGLTIGACILRRWLRARA